MRFTIFILKFRDGLGDFTYQFSLFFIFFFFFCLFRSMYFSVVGLCKLVIVNQ